MPTDGSHERTVVAPERLAGSHRFVDFDEVVRWGSSVEDRVQQALQAYAQERGMDISSLRVVWEMRVEATAWRRPAGVGQDSEEDWLAHIRSADERGMSAVIYASSGF